MCAVNTIVLYTRAFRKHLKTSPAMGVVNGCDIELMVFKCARINVNKIDHTHGSHCTNEY